VTLPPGWREGGGDVELVQAIKTGNLGGTEVGQKLFSRKIPGKKMKRGGLPGAAAQKLTLTDLGLRVTNSGNLF